MKMTQTTLWLGMGVLLIATFQNCSKVTFTQAPSSGAANSNSASVDNPIPSSPSEVLANCDRAMASGALLTFNQKILFEDTKVETGRSQVCEFSTGDNLGMVDSKMQARYEQSRALNLPANAVVCDVEMSTQLQSFRYDDVFFLTFNGRVLATNNQTALKSSLTPESSVLLSNKKSMNIYKYNWLGLRTGGFQNVADDYCLGKSEGVSSCSWPVTESPGNIVFDFAPEVLVSLGLKADASQQRFGFVITGDNDPSSDCYHERLEFSMVVKYYLR